MVDNNIALPQFPSFDPDIDLTNRGERWRKWVDRFENLMLAMSIHAPERKRSMLLYYAGDRVYDIFDTLTGPSGDYESTKLQLCEYFSIKRNISIEILNFRGASQEKNETIDEFYARLVILAVYCEFHDRNEEIKEQIIQTCRSDKLRHRLLELNEKERTLDKVLDIARRLEAVVGTSSSANVDICQTWADQIPLFQPPINKASSSSRYDSQQNESRNRLPTKNDFVTCIKCGGHFPHPGGMKNCPARNVQCNECNTYGHYLSFCDVVNRKKIRVIIENNKRMRKHMNSTLPKKIRKRVHHGKGKSVPIHVTRRRKQRALKLRREHEISAQMPGNVEFSENSGHVRKSSSKDAPIHTPRSRRNKNRGARFKRNHGASHEIRDNTGLVRETLRSDDSHKFKPPELKDRLDERIAVEVQLHGSKQCRQITVGDVKKNRNRKKHGSYTKHKILPKEEVYTTKSVEYELPKLVKEEYKEVDSKCQVAIKKEKVDMDNAHVLPFPNGHVKIKEENFY